MKQFQSANTHIGRVQLTSAITLITLGITAHAETYELPTMNVSASSVHPSQEVRGQVEESFTNPRSSSSTESTELQNINPVNTGDALRLTTTGLVNGPGNDRFGGPTAIRTFGNWSAATSIDGLPAVEFMGTDGGGYSNSYIPSIAIQRIDVQKGGRGVKFGNGSDGGVFETTIKSGREYKNHYSGSLDTNSAGESLMQLETANGTEKYDYYVAGSYLYGDYNGTDEPANLDMQNIGGLVGKVGYNLSDQTRIEMLGMLNDTTVDMYRNDELNEVTSDFMYGAVTIDHSLTDSTSVQVGYLSSNTNSTWKARNRDRSLDINTVFADYFYTLPVSEQIRYDGDIGIEYKSANSLRDDQWDNTFDDYAVKSTNALTFNNNATLTLGLRNTWLKNDIVVDGITQPDNLTNDSVLSWELGAAYSVTDTTRLRASTSTGYNRYYGKYGNFGTDALNPAGAEDTVVESQGYEVGMNYGWSKGYFDAAYYIVTQDNVPRRNGGAIQNVEVEQSGIEMEALAALTNSLTVTGGYTHHFDVKATRDDGTDANGNIFYGDNGVNISHNQFLLRFDHRLTDDWTLWGASIYTDPFERDNADGSTEKRRRSYSRLDLGTAFQFSQKAAVRVRIENATNEKDFSSTLEGAPIETEGKLGRVLWLGFDYTL